MHFIWSLKYIYTSTLEIHHFLAVFISIAYDFTTELVKVSEEITRNKIISSCRNSIIPNTTNKKKLNFEKLSA